MHAVLSQCFGRRPSDSSKLSSALNISSQNSAPVAPLIPFSTSIQCDPDRTFRAGRADLQPSQYDRLQLLEYGIRDGAEVLGRHLILTEENWMKRETGRYPRQLPNQPQYLSIFAPNSRFIQASVSPSRIASLVSSTRSWTSSLSMRLDACLSTVFTLMCIV